MAYKNKKANRRHIKAKRIQEGDVTAKHKREWNRKHKDDKPMGIAEMEALIRQI